MSSAHPDDVLIVGTLIERREHQQFTERQVIPMRMLTRLRGRRVRKAYWTLDAVQHHNFSEAYDLVKLSMLHTGSDPARANLSIAEWAPEPASLIERIAALPEQNATSGREFGRGYAKAIKDVLNLIGQDVADALIN